MKKDRLSFLRSLMPNMSYYFILLVVLNTMLFITRPDYAYVGIALSLILVVYTVYHVLALRNKWRAFTDHLETDILEGSQAALVHMPLPLLMTDVSGKILWHNSKFKKMMDLEASVLDQSIQQVLYNWDWNKVTQPDVQFFPQTVQDKAYSVFKTISEHEDQKAYTFYWFDETPLFSLQQTYDAETPIMVYIQVDNFNETISGAKEGSSPFIISEINSLLKSWADNHYGILHRIDDDEFVMLIQKQYLDQMEQAKFAVLDEIRQISVGNKNPITLSIGISRDGDTLPDRELSSRQALELALGRGGDQAVIRKAGNYEFFGGRSKNVERINRVRSRIVAQGLATLIRESDNVYIMGHRFPDLDSFAATIGVFRCVQNLERSAQIILREVTEPIEEIYQSLSNDIDYEFVRPNEYRNRISQDDLLIIVDTHRPSFTEDPEIISKFTKRVIIDHHRRGTEIVEDVSLMYLEPYASSTAEMVTEILQYITERPMIEAEEANALLAGIVLDTKNFVFNTGVRTFDAASFLRRNGADPQRVREVFKDGLEESIIKSTVLTNANEILPGIVLSVNETPISNIKKLISQGADELIDIKGIHTSFVIGKEMNGEIFVSARSTGQVNVHVILEKLGGGGHLETAGGQFKDHTIEQVQEMLVEQINLYMEEQ